MQGKKLLILYSEVMPYNLATFKCLESNFNVGIKVVYWDKQKLTPYEPKSNSNIEFYPRSKFEFSSLNKFINIFQPDLIFVSGWMDKTYNYICLVQKWKGRKIICGFDTKWNGSVAQIAATYLSPFYFKQRYTHLFVPGLRQYELGRRLGFKHENIVTGAYTADLEVFSIDSEPQLMYASKTIIFVGRLEKVKGVDLLVNEFIKIVENNSRYAGWKLILIGSGSLKGEVTGNEQIIHYEFMNQNEIAKLAALSTFFVLPSRYEPWGLVIQEMSAVGLPLLLSDECGASEEFLIHQYNGLSFKSGCSISLNNALTSMMSIEFEKYIQMSKRSKELSRRASADIWSQRIFNLL